VVGDSLPCDRACALWRQLCEEHRITLVVHDMSRGEGAEISRRLRLKAVPAVLINGELMAVGVQSRDEASALLESVS